MAEIQSNLQSVSWWFSAIIVALVINIISGYAKTFTDRLFSRLSTKWIQRSEKARKAYQLDLKLCISSQTYLVQQQQTEQRLRSQAIYALLFGLLLTLLPTLFLNDLGLRLTAPPTANESTSGLLEFISGIMRLLGALVIIASFRMDSKADLVERLLTEAFHARVMQEISPVSTENSATSDTQSAV